MNSRSGTLGIINRVPGGTIVPAGVVLVVASAVASGAIATQGWLFLGLACRCRVSLLLLSIDFLLKVALVQVLELVQNPLQYSTIAASKSIKAIRLRILNKARSKGCVHMCCV